MRKGKLSPCLSWPGLSAPAWRQSAAPCTAGPWLDPWLLSSRRCSAHVKMKRDQNMAGDMTRIDSWPPEGRCAQRLSSRGLWGSWRAGKSCPRPSREESLPDFFSTSNDIQMSVPLLRCMAARGRRAHRFGWASRNLLEWGGACWSHTTAFSYKGTAQETPITIIKFPFSANLFICCRHLVLQRWHLSQKGFRRLTNSLLSLALFFSSKLLDVCIELQTINHFLR